MFDIETLKLIFKDFLTTTGLVAMLTVAAVDILAGTYEAATSHTFRFELIAKWLETKIMYGILPVLLMHVAAYGLAEPFRTSLTGAANLGAAAFIAAQTASIFNHFKVAPPEEAVPDEDPVPEGAKG